jgi:hypothetical protein
LRNAFQENIVRRILRARRVAKQAQSEIIHRARIGFVNRREVCRTHGVPGAGASRPTTVASFAVDDVAITDLDKARAEQSRRFRNADFGFAECSGRCVRSRDALVHFAYCHRRRVCTLARRADQHFRRTGAKGFSGDDGPATAAQFNQPFGITRGPDGALYICDTGNHRIRRIALDGMISTVAGNGTRGWSGDGGPAIGASLNEPYEVRFDSAGNLFFVERMNHLVRRVDAKSGAISTIAGTGVAGFSGDGGPAVNACFNEPHSIGFDSEGDLYICDINNHRVRKVDMKSGLVSTFAGTGEKKPTPEGKFAFGDKSLCMGLGRLISIAAGDSCWRYARAMPFSISA